MDHTIKAVFFDVDGTIYSHALHDALPNTKTALSQLHEKGIKVGIATSRCRFEMKNTPTFFKTFAFSGFVFDGGALVMDKDQVVSKQVMEVEDVKKVIKYAKKNGLSIRYSTFDGDYFAFEPRLKDKDIFFELYLNTPIVKPYEEDEVFNILIYTQDEELQNQIRNLLPDISMVNHNRVLEINSGQIDKSNGIAELAKVWGITMDEIMCFGDGANDVNLIKEAGIGIAMGNGCEEVTEVADFVSDTVDRDGIYLALRTYGLI